MLKNSIFGSEHRANTRISKIVPTRIAKTVPTRIAALCLVACQVLDAAQGPGGMALQAPSAGADVYITSAHKWVLASKGTAIMCVAEAVQPFVRPIALGAGYNVYTGATGTRPPHTFVALGAALSYLEGFDGGLAAVEAFTMERRAQAIQEIDELRVEGLRLLSPPDASEGLASPLITYALPLGVTAADVARELYTRYNAVVKTTGRSAHPDQWPADGIMEGLRLSFHVFNSREQVTRMVQGLGEVIALVQQRADGGSAVQ